MTIAAGYWPAAIDFMYSGRPQMRRSRRPVAAVFSPAAIGPPQLLVFLVVNLRYLDFRSNLIQGSLPVPPLGTIFFSVSRNNFIGKIPSLICNMTFLNVLDLSHNHETLVILSQS